MRVVVVGSGAREHALASVLGRTAEVVVTPGNPGIPGSVATPPEELEADLFVIGPEVPLVEGLADRLRAAGRLVLGPGADGARLEGSKAFMKQVLLDAEVPTARHRVFDDADAAVAFLDELPGPWVVKTDGLAAGKGVLVAASKAEAEADIRSKLAGDAFGDAGRTVVVEEGMEGPELSVFALCDGRTAVLMGVARDYKRVGDGGVGPNTGGMGAYSPVPEVDDAVVDEIMARHIQPTLETLRHRGVDYRGFLYAGLMLTAEGPRMVEYNIRFGDPEAEAVLPRFDGDLALLLASAAAGSLDGKPTFSDDTCVTVICAAEGYPVAPRTGDRIEGLDEASATEGVEVFSAGVARDADGSLVTAGGRVLAVTGRGPDAAAARERAFAAIGHLRWPGIHFRHDIAAPPAHSPNHPIRPGADR
jgi:phosphoribosylamine--glycine ligase